ncbi:hypothetical protein SDC9_122767 [bioreactor metagenome]|uniref:Uncharacterized protein n=1 Tax=bioreactor metagenome TaxID=1076179 RepID=A0A645CFV0_9ZZZZ
MFSCGATVETMYQVQNARIIEYVEIHSVRQARRLSQVSSLLGSQLERSGANSVPTAMVILTLRWVLLPSAVVLCCCVAALRGEHRVLDLLPDIVAERRRIFQLKTEEIM